MSHDVFEIRRYSILRDLNRSMIAMDFTLDLLLLLSIACTINTSDHSIISLY